MTLAQMMRERLAQKDFEVIPPEILWHNQKLYEFVLEQELVAEPKLLEWVAELTHITFYSSVAEFVPMAELASKLDLGFARRHAFALGSIDSRPTLLSARPYDPHGLRIASLHFGEELDIALSTENQVRVILDEAYRQRSQEEQSEPSLEFEDISQELQETDNLLNVRDKSPLVRVFYESITHAIDNSASDIHYQPTEEGMYIRERIDGVLQDVRLVPKNQQDALLSLIKVMGGMDIAEKRKTQDGRATRWYSDKKVDIRMSVVPTSYGERAVMRLLIKTAKLLDVASLGLNGNNMEKLHTILENFTNGIVLVTGPTGSGKSTTLCAVLSSLNSKEYNIMTIEDPIEYELRGISQLEVQEKKNVTFATGLRALVRQDPDIMMVGEIRDEETASMAVQAALTGHLVFSTMHTNDAPGAVSRLQDLGVEPFLIASSVVAMMAQRLVRRICPHCQEDYIPTAMEVKALGIEGLGKAALCKRGRGCPECLGRGYRGRIAIYEIMIVNDFVRDQIVAKASSAAIKREAVKRGDLSTLRMDGIEKVRQGITTIEEVLRMTQADIY